MHFMRLALPLYLACGTGAMAQDVANGERPLSAIDWLSQTIETPDLSQIAQPLINEPPVADSATSPEITVSPLDSASPDAIGLLPSAVTGLPRNLWSQSDEATLSTLVQATRAETLPAIQELLVTLMLAEADPPLNASATGVMFLARVDKLLDLGALEPAQALIEAAGPETPELFRRWFDVSLLTGTESAACDLMQEKPALSPTYSARIFCLARGQDWTAAALTLNTARALGDVTDEEDVLLSRFLDPDLFEGLGPLPPPSRPSPLVFRMREAIGEGLTTSGLPRAFAHADLRSSIGWRSQIEAAERLARHGAISEATLFSIYNMRTPAASGGVWDRATAIQRFDAAIRDADPDAVARALPSAWSAMQAVRTEVAFARHYAGDLSSLQLEGEAAALAYRIGLLSSTYEAVALAQTDLSGAERVWQGVARGDVSGIDTSDIAGSAVLRAFAAVPTLESIPAPLATLIAEEKLGEALLRAISLFNQGADGDIDALTDALKVMRLVGMEDIARRAALQFLLLDWPS